jgi:hypothetical protein
MASERKDKEEKRMLERRQDTQPAEKWKPFEQYDKFRQPGFWRGDDEEIKRNPALPSPKRNLDRRSFLQAPEAIPLEAAIERVAMEGRYGDTELAHVNPEEKMLLAMNGGAGTVNPSTGAMEFYQDKPAEPATDTDQPKAEQATGVSKFAVKELKALRDMIRDAKRSGKSEDKKTLKEITKRHKKLLENLMSDNPTTDDATRPYGNSLPGEVKGINEGDRFALVPAGKKDSGKVTREDLGSLESSVAPLRKEIEQALSNGKQRPNLYTGGMQKEGEYVTAPRVWHSDKDHPVAMLAYITPEEAHTLSKLDLHGSGVDKEAHFGPRGIQSFQGGGGGGESYDGGGASGWGGGSPGGNDSPTTTSNDLSQSQIDSYSDFGNAMDSLGGMGGTNLGGTNSGFSYDGSDWGFGQSWAPQEAGMYEGQSKASQTFDKTNNWGLGIGDASAFAGTGSGVLGGLNYATQVGFDAASAGVRNSLANMTFGDVAGFLGGAAVSMLAGPAVGGLLGGGIAGAIGGKVAGSYLGGQANNAITSAVNNGLPTGPATSANPNATAPSTVASAGDYDIKSNENLGPSPSNFDPRIAPLTSAEVTPLAVQPTTTVADGNTTNNPFLSGIYIPPIGAPTAGRPLAINT